MAGSIVGGQIETSFDKGIKRFTWLMMRFMAVMVPLVFIINGLTEKAALFDRAAAIKEEMSACASVLSALCSVRGLESAKSVIDEVTARHEKLSNELHAVLRS